MTLTEFKAWFEGYTEGLEGAPTKAQFDRIKEKLAETSIIGKVSVPTPFVIGQDPNTAGYRLPGYGNTAAGGTSSLDQVVANRANYDAQLKCLTEGIVQ